MIDPTRVHARYVTVSLALLLAAALLTSCSGSGGGKHSPSRSSSSGSTGSPVPASSSGSTASGPAAGPAADAATTQAVSTAFATFFSSNSTAAQSQAALQHGDQFTKTLAQQGTSSYADKSSATVTAVHTTSSSAVAAVDFTVSTGSLSLPFQGYAVRTGRTWQVAATTFCQLLTLEGDAPTQCADAAITALPH